MASRTRDRQILWVAFLIALAIHFIALYSPGSAEQLGPSGVDKLVHICLFALIVTPALLLGFPVVPVICLAVAQAGVSEVLQAVWIPNRSGDILDLVADLLGIALGWGIWYSLPAQENDVPEPESSDVPAPGQSD